MKHLNPHIFALFLAMAAAVAMVASCARMGRPDGGWYDETPPRILRCTPAEKSTAVTSKKIDIYFDEYIKLDNPSEKVTISPAQIEQPEVKTTGKGIRVELKDSLKPGMTYTIDFSDAITDNNEGNPLGNYTYVFSTGDIIDTLEVAGYVVNAQDLEPVKGMMVGLHSNLADSAFQKEPLQRIGKTDSEGHFIIRGVAPGSYRIYGLADSDGDFLFSQRGEMLAFSHDIIVPTMKEDIRQDTLWTDSLHINAIRRSSYNHYLPDDVVLRAFQHEQTDRFFLKSERSKEDRFSLFFSYGDKTLPEIKPLNFDEKAKIIVEHSLNRDTITYWLQDSILINQDTLRFAMTYNMTDTLGCLVSSTDTLEVLAKTPYAKRQKALKEKIKEWEKKQEKKRKNGEPVEEAMPQEALEPEFVMPRTMAPTRHVTMTLPSPVANIDTSMIHLYAKHDTLWYRSPIRFTTDTLRHRTYHLQGEWRLGTEYSLEIDSACFRDIYGRVTPPIKKGIKVPTESEFGSLFVEMNADVLPKDSTATGGRILIQLLDGSDKIMDEQPLVDGIAEFYYLSTGEYYLRALIDSNDNGRWDTGDYNLDLQPEEIFYYPEKVACIANRDVTVSFNPLSRKLFLQKPNNLKKQKADKKKEHQNRNAERAKKLGKVAP